MCSRRSWSRAAQAGGLGGWFGRASVGGNLSGGRLGVFWVAFGLGVDLTCPKRIDLEPVA